MQPRLEIDKGFDAEIRLAVAELVDPPVVEQDLPISDADEIQWVMVAKPTDTTALLSKTLSDGDISFIEDALIKFDLSHTETDLDERYWWELRMTLNGKYYRSHEMGIIDAQTGIAVAYPPA